METESAAVLGQRSQQDGPHALGASPFEIQLIEDMNISEALMFANDALRKSGSTIEVNTLKARVESLVKEKRGCTFKKALLDFESAVRRNPRNAEYRECHGDSLFESSSYNEALVQYRMAGALSNDKSIHAKMFSCHLRLGELEEAKREIEWAPEEDRTAISQELEDAEKVRRNMKYYWHMCTLLRMKEHWMLALFQVEQLIDAGFRHKLLLIFKAEVLLNTWSYDEAKEVLDQVLKGEFPLNPSEFIFGMVTDAYMHLVHAKILMATGRIEDALKAAKEADQLDPLNVEVKALVENLDKASKALGAGNNFYNQKNYEAAFERYKLMKKYTEKYRIVERNMPAGELKEQKIYAGTRNATGLFNLAEQYTIMKREMPAGELKEQKIYAGPRSAIRLCNLAACCWKLQKFEKCITYCNKAIKAWPDLLISTLLLLYRAVSYFKLEKWQNCVRDLQAVSMICHRDNKIGRLFEVEDDKMRVTGVILTGANSTKAPTTTPTAAPSDHKENDKPLTLEGPKDKRTASTDPVTQDRANADEMVAKSEPSAEPVDAPKDQN